MLDVSPSIRCANSPDIAPPAGHYSHVCVAGGQIYISGQLPVTGQGVALTNATFTEQAKQTLHNLDGCLSTAGVGRCDLVQVRIYVTDMRQWPVFNRIYAEWIGSHRPARAVAGVSELHYGVAVEVEAVALDKQR
ncbi:RidA family protein [Luteimonas sp. R10]|uniref:RidA family protein n=1 Tax=Luteimonas sp. R10 TaxID=3108176 RepID=UPI003089A423|nr:RidA family protein [Luteimonas sp. R10]